MPPDDPAYLTSYHVRRAREGSRESVEWVVKKFTPILLASAQYRLRGTLRSLYDPEDVVQEVWAIVIPKLTRIVPQADRYTPVVMKFLSTTLIQHVNNLIRKHIAGKPGVQKPSSSSGDQENEPLLELEANLDGEMTRLMRREAKEAVFESIQKLDEKDREIVVLRGIEQHPYKEIATLLKEDPKVLAVWYQRALKKLRDHLPGSIFAEFGDG